MVTITEPSPLANISSDSFILRGKIVSLSALEGVILTVTAAQPSTSTEIHRFSINYASDGTFETSVSTDNLFKGNNNINVAATNSGGCTGEGNTMIVYVKMVKVRISGTSFLNFAQGDPQDHYAADNQGFLHVTHNPGCGLQGNNGNDQFFAAQHNLPFWAKLEGVEFEQFWPKERQANSCGIGGWFGGGSYLTRMERGDPAKSEPLITVHWENACCGDYATKNIEYVISFIVAVDEDVLRAGNSLGEPTFDPNLTPLSAIQPPSGFQLSQPAQPGASAPQPPPGPAKLVVTISFDTRGNQPFPVTAWAQGNIVTKTGTVGDTTFKITSTQQMNPGGVASVNLSANNLMPGTWSVSVLSTETGKVGGNTCQAYVPGTVVFDFSGGTGGKCVSSPY
jgi:hypothetical protein